MHGQGHVGHKCINKTVEAGFYSRIRSRNNRGCHTIPVQYKSKIEFNYSCGLLLFNWAATGKKVAFFKKKNDKNVDNLIISIC